MLQRFNTTLALRLSAMFATMECFYAFTLLVLLPLIWPRSLEVVQFISSGWLQLVALPLLAVSGVIIGTKAEERAAQDHAAIMELVSDLHAKHDALHEKITNG